MDHDKNLKSSLESGRYLWGTLDTWLIWKLTAGSLYVTDFSSAATSGLFNIVEKTACIIRGDITNIFSYYQFYTVIR